MYCVYDVQFDVFVDPVTRSYRYRSNGTVFARCKRKPKREVAGCAYCTQHAKMVAREIELEDIYQIDARIRRMLDDRDGIVEGALRFMDVLPAANLRIRR